MNYNYYTYDSPFGKIVIESDGNAITSIKTCKNTKPFGIMKANKLTDKAAEQLSGYFSGKRRKFDLPLHPHGTQFQQKVWKELCEIPYGETRSYKDIANTIGNPNACRAVGMANNKNPIWIMIPCHRVIGSNGKLTGYGGGLKMKQGLLNLEEGNKKER